MKFDAEAVQPDKLTLKWDAVSGAASYTVACWADGTDESKAVLVEKIDGTACTLDKLTPETKYNAKVKAVSRPHGHRLRLVGQGFGNHRRSFAGQARRTRQPEGRTRILDRGADMGRRFRRHGIQRDGR